MIVRDQKTGITFHISRTGDLFELSVMKVGDMMSLSFSYKGDLDELLKSLGAVRRDGEKMTGDFAPFTCDRCGSRGVGIRYGESNVCRVCNAEPLPTRKELGPCPETCGTYHPLDMSTAVDGDRRYSTGECRAAGRCLSRPAPSERKT